MMIVAWTKKLTTRMMTLRINPPFPSSSSETLESNFLSFSTKEETNPESQTDSGSGSAIAGTEIHTYLSTNPDWTQITQIGYQRKQETKRRKRDTL